MSDDRRLVAAVLAREPGAFARLVETYQKLVWHLIHRMVNDVEDTRELAQDVFLLVHRQLPQFRFDAALGTWIGQIAFSRASRHLRRKRLPISGDAEGDRDGPLPDVLLKVRDPHQIDQAVGDEQLLRALAQAIERLPPLQRTIVTLYHLDELSVAKVATITGVPEGTVKSHLFRARRQLRDQLEPLLGDSP